MFWVWWSGLDRMQGPGVVLVLFIGKVVVSLSMTR